MAWTDLIPVTKTRAKIWEYINALIGNTEYNKSGGLNEYSSRYYENIVIDNNSSNPNTQLDVSFDRILFAEFEETSFSDTIDITTDLDTGSPSNSTWYYVWIMFGSGETTIAKFSLSQTDPNLPSGYTEAFRIGCKYRDGSGYFTDTHQWNNICYFPLGVVALQDGTSSSPASVDMSGIIPPYITKLFSGRGTLYSPGGGLYIFSGNTTDQWGRKAMNQGIFGMDYIIELVENINSIIYYFVTGSNMCQIAVSHFKIII